MPLFQLTTPNITCIYRYLFSLVLGSAVVMPWRRTKRSALDSSHDNARTVWQSWRPSKSHQPYRPLRSKRAEIRLLHLHSGSGEDAVSCVLEHAFLDREGERPSYETISYHWGDALVRENIVVDGVDLSVAVNTAAALRRMRKASNNRVLWIDAVCINQDDYDERSQQVELMTEVYHYSAGNLIHVADYPLKAAQAVQNIQDLREEIARETDPSMEIEDYYMVLEGPFKLKFSENASSVNVDEEALEELFTQPWFG